MPEAPVTQQPIPVEETQFTPLERKAKQLIVLTYLFSQGSRSTQSLINRWLHRQNLLPTEGVDYPKIIASIHPPKVHENKTEDEVQSEQGKVISEYEEVFSGKDDKVPIEELEEKILLNMLYRDLLFQYKARENRSAEKVETDSTTHPSDGSQDPHKSFIRKHLVNNHTTGAEELDELMKRLKPSLLNIKMVSKWKEAIYYQDPDELLDNIDSLHINEAFTNLASMWESNHPGEKFMPKPTPAKAA